MKAIIGIVAISLVCGCASTQVRPAVIGGEAPGVVVDVRDRNPQKLTWWDQVKESPSKIIKPALVGLGALGGLYWLADDQEWINKREGDTSHTIILPDPTTRIDINDIDGSTINVQIGDSQSE